MPHAACLGDPAGSLDQQIDLSLLLPPPDSAMHVLTRALPHARRRACRCHGLTVRGLSFFATTLLVYDSENATIADCSFTYASASYAASLGSPWGLLVGSPLGSTPRPLQQMTASFLGGSTPRPHAAAPWGHDPSPTAVSLGLDHLPTAASLGRPTIPSQPSCDDRKQKIES